MEKNCVCVCVCVVALQMFLYSSITGGNLKVKPMSSGYGTVVYHQGLYT